MPLNTGTIQDVCLFRSLQKLEFGKTVHLLGRLFFHGVQIQTYQKCLGLK